MFELATKPPFLVTPCALGYAVATVGMKMASDTPHVAIYGAIALCLGATVVGEVLSSAPTTGGMADRRVDLPPDPQPRASALCRSADLLCCGVARLLPRIGHR